MKRYRAFGLAVAAAILFQQPALADQPADRCAATPYLGACQQGCDGADQGLPEAFAMAPVAARLDTAQVDCASHPYLGPVCGYAD